LGLTVERFEPPARHQTSAAVADDVDIGAGSFELAGEVEGIEERADGKRGVVEREDLIVSETRAFEELLPQKRLPNPAVNAEEKCQAKAGSQLLA
jgi:hypothetical protein